MLLSTSTRFFASFDLRLYIPAQFQAHRVSSAKLMEHSKSTALGIPVRGFCFIVICQICEPTRFARSNDTQDLLASFISFRLQEHLLRTVSYLLNAIAGYLLMLVVSTWNIWLFITIVAGLGFGYFLSNPLYTWYCSKFRNIERVRDQRKNNYYRSKKKPES